MKFLKKLKFHKDSSNSGSAIVTVIVVVAFISIIATTLLYVTAVNYRMKQVDYKNKTSFYSGEVPMEEIKARFAWDLADSCGKAYGNIIGEYALSNEGYRAQGFQDMVADDLIQKWNDSLTAYGGDWSLVLQSYVEGSYAGAVSLAYPNPLPVGYTPIEYDSVKGTITFHGISLEYTENGFLTKISTDIFIAIPALDWSAQTSQYHFTGMTPEQIEAALKRETIDTSDCVVYINWSKD